MTIEEINRKLIKLLYQGNVDVDKIIKSTEIELLKCYKISLEAVKKEIAWIYEKYGESVKYSNLQDYNRFSNLENEIQKQINLLNKDIISATSKGIKEIYKESYYRTGYALESSMGIKLGFGLLNPDLVQGAVINPLLKIKWPENVKDASKKYIAQISTELTQGFSQGKGYVKIARLVTEATQTPIKKSIRIIRTEGHRVQNAARVVSFDKSEKAAQLLGVKTERYWIHPEGVKEPRPDHIEMDGKPANEESKFILPDGTITDGPGLSGVADHDINCHCTTALRIIKLPETQKQITYENYEDWYQRRILKK